MAITNGFFTPLLMAEGQGISQEFVESNLIKPVEKMQQQLNTAINYKNTPENIQGLEKLDKCAQELTRALYGPSAVEEPQEEPYSGPSLSR